MNFQSRPPSRLKAALNIAFEEEQRRKAEEAKIEKVKPTENWAKPEDMPERLRIIFDDSGSMGRNEQGSKLWDAKEGTVELFKNCLPNQTACAVHPLEYDYIDLSKLSTNLPALGVLVRGIPCGGSTPLFEVIKKAQACEPKATRYIAFSDGAPDYGDQQQYENEVIQKAQEEKTPIDTVLIWAGSREDDTYMKQSREYKTLNNLAEKTGGYFLVFDRNKMDFKKGLKYLAPKNRLMLMNEQVRKDLEEGRLK